MADRKRVLVADDDPDLRDLLILELQHKGFEVLVAEDGKQAIETLSREKADLVVMDIMMPNIDGYHAANEICSRLGADAPKIILMTSRDTEKEKGVALMSGANAFLQKPFTMEDLYKTIDSVLK